MLPAYFEPDSSSSLDRLPLGSAAPGVHGLMEGHCGSSKSWTNVATAAAVSPPRVPHTIYNRTSSSCSSMRALETAPPPVLLPMLSASPSHSSDGNTVSVLLAATAGTGLSGSIAAADLLFNCPMPDLDPRLCLDPERYRPSHSPAGARPASAADGDTDWCHVFMDTGGGGGGPPRLRRGRVRAHW